jgi:hypothetical protein
MSDYIDLKIVVCSKHGLIIRDDETCYMCRDEKINSIIPNIKWRKKLMKWLTKNMVLFL